MSTQPNITRAPFTSAQVESIREFQKCDYVHSLTCLRHSNVALTVATGDLRCMMSNCGYTQNWVHANIANGEWREVAKQVEEFVQKGKQAQEKPACDCDGPYCPNDVGE